MSFRSPLYKATGHGSAKEGSGHWMMQRITAIGLILITGWLVYATFNTPAIDYNNMTAEQMRNFALAWFATPCNSVMTILFLIAMFWHGTLGIQVVIEDYIHTEWMKVSAIITIKILSFAAAVTGIFSVLSIYFKG